MTLLEEFKSLYCDLNKDTLAKLPSLYDSNVVFQDPVHRVESLGALQGYFNSICTGLSYCKFEFLTEHVGERKAFYRWVMHFSHPRIHSGQEQSLRGVSYLEFNQKILYHEDYYDMGAMLYEQVPLLGTLVKALKTRLKN